MTRFKWLHRWRCGHWPSFIHREGEAWRKRCIVCGRNYL